MSIRIDSTLKSQAEEILSQPGMTISGTINMFLTQIVIERAVPLNLYLSPQDKIALNVISMLVSSMKLNPKDMMQIMS